MCQGNHYQFDDLRRAKHTSMMSLYHMHNPDVPKFLVTCSNCNVDINSGYCYTSEKDTEFHLCQVCLAFTLHHIILYLSGLLSKDAQGFRWQISFSKVCCWKWFPGPAHRRATSWPPSLHTIAYAATSARFWLPKPTMPFSELQQNEGAL